DRPALVGGERRPAREGGGGRVDGAAAVLAVPVGHVDDHALVRRVDDPQRFPGEGIGPLPADEHLELPGLERLGLHWDTFWGGVRRWAFGRFPKAQGLTPNAFFCP